MLNKNKVAVVLFHENAFEGKVCSFPCKRPAGAENRGGVGTHAPGKTFNYIGIIYMIKQI